MDILSLLEWIGWRWLTGVELKKLMSNPGPAHPRCKLPLSSWGLGIRIFFPQDSLGFCFLVVLHLHIVPSNQVLHSSSMRQPAASPVNSWHKRPKLLGVQQRMVAMTYLPNHFEILARDKTWQRQNHQEKRITRTYSVSRCSFLFPWYSWMKGGKLFPCQQANVDRVEEMVRNWERRKLVDQSQKMRCTKWKHEPNKQRMIG